MHLAYAQYRIVGLEELRKKYLLISVSWNQSHLLQILVSLYKHLVH